jgi:hypothetical protein
MHRRLVHHEEQERAMNPNKPIGISVFVGASLLAKMAVNFASKLAPTMVIWPNLQSGMNRYSRSFLLLTLFSFFHTAQAGELGRLFFTPQQRQQLEFQETSNNSGESGHRNYIIVNGVVQKHGGSRTVWINGTAQPAEQGSDKTPSAATVAVPGKSQPIHLKVGQRLLLDSAPPEEEK